MLKETKNDYIFQQRKSWVCHKNSMFYEKQLIFAEISETLLFSFVKTSKATKIFRKAKFFVGTYLHITQQPHNYKVLCNLGKERGQ